MVVAKGCGQGEKSSVGILVMLQFYKTKKVLEIDYATICIVNTEKWLR